MREREREIRGKEQWKFKWFFKTSFCWGNKIDKRFKFVKLGGRVNMVYLPSVRHIKCSLSRSAASWPSYVGKGLAESCGFIPHPWVTRMPHEEGDALNVGFPGGSDGEESTCNAGDLGLTQSIRSQRIRHDWVTKDACMHAPSLLLPRVFRWEHGGTHFQFLSSWK